MTQSFSIVTTFEQRRDNGKREMADIRNGKDSSMDELTPTNKARSFRTNQIKKGEVDTPLGKGVVLREDRWIHVEVDCGPWPTQLDLELKGFEREAFRPPEAKDGILIQRGYQIPPQLHPGKLIFRVSWWLPNSAA